VDGQADLLEVVDALSAGGGHSAPIPTVETS
jgi:hypothetical protein